MMKPVDHNKRYSELDALRGFALFGILLANLYSFFGYSSHSSYEIVHLPNADRAVLFVIDWFVEGKFYSIFSMLFGMGFALQSMRMSDDQEFFADFWFRRMKLLICFGLIHMFLIWHGDILTLYALMGMLLIFFVNFSARALLKTALILLCLPFLMHVIVTITQNNDFWTISSNAINAWQDRLGYADKTLLELRTSDNPVEVFFINIIKALGRPMSYLQTGRIPQVLGMFILGFYLMKSWKIKNDETSEIIKNWRIFFVVGAIASFGYAWTKFEIGSPYALDTFGMYQAVIYHFGAPCFALGIAGFFLHLWKNTHTRRYLAFFVPLGRMALSNYITQNTLGVLLFFGYGLALMQKIPFAYIPIFAILILATQWLFSTFWLSRFKQGPLENIWRRYSYGTIEDNNKKRTYT